MFLAVVEGGQGAGSASTGAIDAGSEQEGATNVAHKDNGEMLRISGARMTATYSFVRASGITTCVCYNSRSRPGHHEISRLCVLVLVVFSSAVASVEEEKTAAAAAAAGRLSLF